MCSPNGENSKVNKGNQSVVSIDENMLILTVELSRTGTRLTPNEGRAGDDEKNEKIQTDRSGKETQCQLCLAPVHVVRMNKMIALVE